MRLLNTSTLQLQEFFDSNIPPYAILSHRWEKAEVTFQDMQTGSHEGMTGFLKIKGCCRQAKLDGFEWVWIDSCCINKTSSSELSEAINSMFRWYQDAKVCYAYLSDVPNTTGDRQALALEFPRSKWFTRCWTLQELLAPNIVVFFDRGWIEIGTKSSLEKLISDVTKIRNISRWQDACIAQKMSWASFRQTTRVEDAAYCLMGLFGVHMPLIYGEGQKAFIRLQLEILKQSDDESLFAWNVVLSGHAPESGLLADSPVAFRNSGQVERHVFYEHRPAYSMTNKGLCIELYLIPNKYDSQRYLAPLNCKMSNEEEGLVPLAITLARISPGQYTRKAWYNMTPEPLLFYQQQELKRHVVHVQQLEMLETPAKGFRELSFQFLTASLAELGLVGIPFAHEFDSDLRTDVEAASLTLQGTDSGGGLVFQSEGSDIFAVKVDTFDDRPGVHLKALDEVPISSSLNDWPFPSRRIDRISKRLRSGTSVSVALKPSGLRTYGPYSGYMVDITVDPKGGLRWPEE